MAPLLPTCFTVFQGLPFDVASRIRAGIPASLVDEIAALVGVRLEVFCTHLGLSVDRIDDLAGRGDTLESWEAGRLYWVATAYFEAEQVLGSGNMAAEWLRGRVGALGSVEPLSFLDTPSGYELVMNTLAKIKHGVFA